MVLRKRTRRSTGTRSRTTMVAVTLIATAGSALAGAQAHAHTTQAHAHTTQACLNRPADHITVGPEGTQTTLYEVWVPQSNHTYDLRPSVWHANLTTHKDDRRPLRIRGIDDGTCVVGGSVVGQQSRDLTWREVKTDYDGDGIWLRAPDPGVHYTVHDMRFDNTHDALTVSTTAAGAQRDIDWEVNGVYAKYTRDDFVENDNLHNGKIHDTLVDG